ncbi:hypothetical protein KSP40_PGU013477 [Platanthera guangdongensis]|uniref:Chlororespiratory reduction 42 n=1 Tax=Platanthera guangdongensis TaxID=2320717 RepID=A0ABR2LLM2_9ASPA
MAAATSLFARSSTALTPNHVHLRSLVPRYCPLRRFRLLSTRVLSVTGGFSAPVEVCVKESVTVPGNLENVEGGRSIKKIDPDVSVEIKITEVCYRRRPLL